MKNLGILFLSLLIVSCGDDSDGSGSSTAIRDPYQYNNNFNYNNNFPNNTPGNFNGGSTREISLADAQNLMNQQSATVGNFQNSTFRFINGSGFDKYSLRIQSMNATDATVLVNGSAETLTKADTINFWFQNPSVDTFFSQVREGRNYQIRSRAIYRPRSYSVRNFGNQNLNNPTFNQNQLGGNGQLDTIDLVYSISEVGNGFFNVSKLYTVVVTLSPQLPWAVNPISIYSQRPLLGKRAEFNQEFSDRERLAEIQ